MKIFDKPIFANKEESEFAARKQESLKRSEQIQTVLADIDFDALPETDDVDLDSETALAATTPEVATAPVEKSTAKAEETSVSEDTYVLDNADDFELNGYVACTYTTPKFITFFDPKGNVVFSGERATAVTEFAALTPEELAAVYGSGEIGLNAGLAAIDELLSVDDTGFAQNLVEENSALYASYAAYVGIDTASNMGQDAITMAF